MDPKEEMSRDVCTKILQKGVRQQRYILKGDFFAGRTVEQALSNKPPKVTQQNWEALFNKWKFVKRTRRSEELSSITKLQALGLILPISTNFKKTSTTMRTLVQLSFSKRPIPIERRDA